MQSQLAAIVGDLEAASRRVHELHRRLQFSGAWMTRPAAAEWSAADCVAHLNLTSAALLPLLDAAIGQAREHREPPPARYRRDAMGWLMWQLVAPAGGLKTTTIAAFEPSGTPSTEGLVFEFDDLQAAVVARVREADGLPLQRVKVRSPFDGRVSFNLYSALALVPRHQDRHLHQAEQAARRCAVRLPAAV